MNAVSENRTTRNNQRGQSIVEISLITPLLLIALYIPADFGVSFAGDRDARAALLGYSPGRSGDLIVMPKPYWFFVTADGSPQPGSATSHGTMYGYDQQVPIILFGRGIKPGEYARQVTPADIAPTLAYLCGVTLAHADGEVLSEAPAPPAPSAQRGR